MSSRRPPDDHESCGHLSRCHLAMEITYNVSSRACYATLRPLVRVRTISCAGWGQWGGALVLSQRRAVANWGKRYAPFIKGKRIGKYSESPHAGRLRPVLQSSQPSRGCCVVRCQKQLSVWDGPVLRIDPHTRAYPCRLSTSCAECLHRTCALHDDSQP
jgi:hypothetical protein